jgi:2-keto-3-deoxy-L-rhamnonate aldolase RhmA
MAERNAIKRALAEGSWIKGVHFTFPATPILEVLGRIGLDFVYLDGEHGSFDRGNLEASCLVAERYGITPIARVPANTPAAITRFLDAGVRGIVVPHVESVEEARRAIRATYFAPLGERSFGAGRPDYAVGVGDLPGHLLACNAATSLCLMIESGAALEVAGEIAAIDGVDYLSFGMMDLAQSLGHPGDPSHPDVERGVAGAVAAIHAAGKRVRQDFMTFRWVQELIVAGAAAELGLGR